jgi:hypothetical protein
LSAFRRSSLRHRAGVMAFLLLFSGRKIIFSLFGGVFLLKNGAFSV